MKISILFICHGNICRSPMAEFYMKDLVARKGIAEHFFIASAGTSTEEIGHGVHRDTKRILTEKGIAFNERRAVQVTKRDYGKYDYLVVMDHWNARNLMGIIGEDPYGKVSLLLDHASPKGDIADPWYSGDFEITYSDIERGCNGLLEEIRSQRGQTWK